MSELPSGWAQTTIGDLLRFNYGKGLPERDRSGSGFPVFGSNGVVGFHDQALVQAESLVVGRKGSVGEVHHSPGPCWPIDTTYFVDDFSRMPPRFWYYALKSLDLAELNRATAIPGLNREDAYKIDFALAPLNEQKRIADKLDAILARVNACREHLDRVPAILKRFRQSVLARATSGKLTEEWRDRLKGRTPWQAIQLRDLSELITKGASPKWQGFSYVQPGKGILFITSENVREMRLDVAEPKYVESALNDAQKRSILRKGDLLTNIVGASIGRTAIYDLSLPANINQAVCLVRLKDEVNGRFILYVLSSPSVIDYMHGEKVDVARANLSLEDIGDIPLNIPERDEQDEIVRRVETLFAYAEHLEARYTDARAQVERLTPALLAKSFRGELVPQDPSDEPAAVLLERIGALRAAAAKLPRPSKATQTNKEVRELMQKLLDVLEAAKEWLPAEEAFRRCGVSDGSQTDRLEELYAELRQLDKAGALQVRRIGDFDELRLERKA